MSRNFESSLDELTIILDQLVREYVMTHEKHRRTKIATEISELTARFSAISLASSHRGFASFADA